MIVKTHGGTVEEALVKPGAMIAATLGDSARAEGSKSPGTRAKMAAMLREELLKAQNYARKVQTAEADKKPPRDLRLEALAQVLSGETPLLVTAQRSRDILTALRIREEFGNFPMVLDGAAEAYEVLEQVRASGVPVIVHPTMYRADGETENLSFETASKLRAAGIPFALQSGFEAYVPKSRLVLFEAALAAANGLTREQALASITIDAARLIGVADRVGSLEVGKDGDVALYDGDPFEYTSHCVGVVIEGRVVSEEKR
jgi:imidazolonepropionase-like amidohydrolase